MLSRPKIFIYFFPESRPFLGPRNQSELLLFVFKYFHFCEISAYSTHILFQKHILLLLFTFIRKSIEKYLLIFGPLFAVSS